MLRRLSYTLSYWLGTPRWDTSQVVPELIAYIEGEKPEPGRAIDLGCGTGTNAVYLAEHGWEVVGVDFVGSAIRKARRRARRTGVEGKTRFVVTSVTRLDRLKGPPFDLALDVGCLHSLTPDDQRDYADGLARRLRPGATFLLYAFGPRQRGHKWIGLTLNDVHGLFGVRFRVLDVQQGTDTASGLTSAWYRLERKA
jgi:SAM-dependent methyltransferase